MPLKFHPEATRVPAVYDTPFGAGRASERQRHAAICKGWDGAQDYLRPGFRYSELSSAVAEVVRKEGREHFRNPVVHRLGLEHTDDPKSPAVQPQDSPDRALEPGMLVNVDLPHTEIGWGSLHTEDRVVIADNGCERSTTAELGMRN